MISHTELARLKTRLQNLLSHALSWSGVCYRSASIKYANSNDLITGIGSLKSGGRWNPLGSFPTVYLSRELDTAFKESFAHLSYYGYKPHQALPRTFAAVQVSFQRILDLTDPAVLKRLKVSRRSLLLLDWRMIQDAGGEALTQALGRLSREVGFEGLLTPSAAAKGGANLIYFPDVLLAASQAVILNSSALPAKT
jgi:RES domain-containing protein